MHISIDHGKLIAGLALALAISLAGLLYYISSHPRSTSITGSTSENLISSGNLPADHADQTERVELPNYPRHPRHPRAIYSLVQGVVEEERNRYDQPGEAAEEYLRKRLPEGETALPVERYLTAVESLRAMPQYSTLRNRMLPALRETAASRDALALDGWKSLGPGNVGGRTRVLIAHPTNPDVMYAAAAAGGVWKTTDAGMTWKPLADLLPNLAVNALALDPANPEVIYAGTGEGFYNFDAVRGAGIFKSFDGGGAWRRLDKTGTPDFHYVNDIVVSHLNRNRVYAVTRTGIHRSFDGGVNWTKVFDARNGGCLDLAIRTDQTTDYIFATCGTEISSNQTSSVQSSILRNIDAAAGLSAWSEVYSETGMGRTSLAISPSNQNMIYALSSENGADGAPHSLHAVFRSDNSGEPGSWKDQVRGRDGKSLNTTLLTNPIFAFYSECGKGGSQYYNQGWYNNVIAVDPKDENIVWVGGVDLFRSDDGGANWGMASFWHLPQTNPRYVHADHHAIVFHPNFNGATNRTIFVGTDGGIFRAENARAQTVKGPTAPCSSENSRFVWTSLNRDFAITQFYHGAPLPGGLSYLGGAQDNGVVIGSDDQGANSWRELLSGDGGYVAVDPNNPKVIYAETTGLSLKKSTDGGVSFRPATTGISNFMTRFIAPFTMDPGNPEQLWIGGRNLFRTRNGAVTWAAAGIDFGAVITAIAVAPSDGNFVVAGTESGNIHRTTTGLKTDGDTMWPVAQPRGGNVSWLAFDPGNRDIVYATYSNFGGKHVWRSLDRGESWQSIDGSGVTGLPDVPIHCIVIDPTNPQRLYVGTDVGVFVSLDGGGVWALENTGFANAPVESLSINTVGGVAHLFAFTHGRGAWRVPLGNLCSATLTSTTQIFMVEGGQGSVSVFASSSECQWTAESNAPWLTITGGSPGRGSGVVTFNVASSRESKTRSAAITIAGKTVSVMQAGVAVSVSAASLKEGALAPESIVSVFGDGMADTIQVAGVGQLPTTLANTTIKIKDSAGVERPAPLFFISPNQINYLMPAGTAIGRATVLVANGSDGFFSGTVQINNVAPGLFTANSSGVGVAVGQALRVKFSGGQSYEPLAAYDTVQNRFIARPIDLGPDLGGASDQLFLILYGTGLKFRSSLAAVTAKIGEITVPALYVGEQGNFAGLDQVNLPIPRSLAGRGEMDIVLTFDGQPANIVRISVK